MLIYRIDSVRNKTVDIAQGAVATIGTGARGAVMISLARDTPQGEEFFTVMLSAEEWANVRDTIANQSGSVSPNSGRVTLL